MKVLARFILVFACIMASDSPANEAEPDPASVDELKTRIARLIDEHEVPSVGVALVDADGEDWVGSLGVADREREVPADADTLYRIGSTSKMFVALAVLRLVEQGRLSLDDRLVDLAPEIEFENPWAATDPVRLVHLLEHTTGWDDIHLPEFAHNDPTPVTLREALDFHPHSRTSRWKPGTRMSYCNAGPPVAAYIIEKITGLDFEAYVQYNLFDPLGMETATYRLDDVVREKGATLYSRGQPQEYWHISMRPSGAINASPRDMAKFLGLLLRRGMVDDWPLVSGESLARMERTETTNGARAGLEVGYGLANYSSGHEHWIFREHGGGVLGGLTELAYLPEAGIGHVIMINSDDSRALNEISDLVRDYETAHLAKPVVASDVAPTAADRALEGYYYPINPRQQIGYFLSRIFSIQTLRFEGDRLARKPAFGGEPVYYLPRGDARYASEMTGRISLVGTTDPLAGEVVHHGSTVLKPVSSVRVWLQWALAGLWGLFVLSALLFAPVWLVRWLLGRLPPGGPVRVRLWPLLAALSVVAFLVLGAVGMNDPFDRLGSPTAVSTGLMIASVLFAVFSVLGVLCAFGTRNGPVNRAAWWHSSAVSALNLVVAAYLLAHGIIGVATWA
jgi:CubicO group peptidase (beta-lactamase class C family)